MLYKISLINISIPSNGKPEISDSKIIPLTENSQEILDGVGERNLLDDIRELMIQFKKNYRPKIQ
jgi:hypothetical protein